MLIFHEVHPGAALLLGPMLIGLPYSILMSTIAGDSIRQGPLERAQ
jgi:hypothetical protein